MITSANNTKIKFARGLLASKKNRDESGCYVIEGVRLAEEAITAGVQPEFAFFSDRLSERGRKIIELLGKQNIEIEEVAADLLDRISATQTSQGLLMVARFNPPKLDKTLDFVLVLDQLRDPGNMGTLLRSAAALGAQAVLLTPGSADAYAPKVLRAGMGAHFNLQVAMMSAEAIAIFCRTTNTLPLTILLADSSAGGLCWEENLTCPLCLVIGGEAEGAGRTLKQISDKSIRIPMLDATESYNAAVAGSILLYEIFRQRTIQ